MSGEDEVDNDFPAEHVQTVQNFQSSLSELESVMKVLLDVPLSEVHETKATTPLEKARIDIISAFAFNSLTWMWLRTQGINPKETEVSTIQIKILHGQPLNHTLKSRVQIIFLSVLLNYILVILSFVTRSKQNSKESNLLW